MKRIFQFKRMYLLLLTPISLLLVLFARINNEWVEHFYIPYIYSPIRAVVGSFTSLFPFSVTEVVVLVAFCLCIWYIIRVILQLVKNKGAWKHILYKFFINLLCTASILLFGFELCMGLNYYRYSVTEYLGLEVKKSSATELYEVCKILVNDMNESRSKMDKNAANAAVLSDKNRYETSDAARDAYKKLGEKYPVLKGTDIKNKPLVSSRLFSYFLTTGIYIPYTFESNINVDVPEYTIPATMCHELTHSRGFMREEEANFLGYLACMYSDRADFNYSGSIMAFNYCFEKLYDADKALAKEIAAMCDKGIVVDMTIESQYWDKYWNTPTAEAGDAVYDGYLQANGQQSGIKSYGLMVDLLIAYYTQK